MGEGDWVVEDLEEVGSSPVVTSTVSSPGKQSNGVSIGSPAPEVVANSVIEQAARASWNGAGKLAVTDSQLGRVLGQSQAGSGSRLDGHVVGMRFDRPVNCQPRTTANHG